MKVKVFAMMDMVTVILVDVVIGSVIIVVASNILQVKDNKAKCASNHRWLLMRESCPTLTKYYWIVQFLSHGQSSSLKVSLR